MFARERHIPVFEALGLDRTPQCQRLLIDGLLFLPYAHGEHVGLDGLMLVQAGYQLEAAKVAGKTAAYGAAADAAYWRAVYLFALNGIEEIHVGLDFFTLAFAMILEVPCIRSFEINKPNQSSFGCKQKVLP